MLVVQGGNPAVPMLVVFELNGGNDMHMDCVESLQFIVQTMKGFEKPWFIAGGWALELASGTVTREHEDIDICVFREHTDYTLSYFTDWQIQVAIPGEHRLVPCISVSDTLPPRYCLHLNKGNQFIEIMLTDKVDDHVICRKNRSITMPINQFCRVDDCGRPFVAPEWQLLFKAKEKREKDVRDFVNHAPAMARESKIWLLHAMQIQHPESQWIMQLKEMIKNDRTCGKQ